MFFLVEFVAHNLSLLRKMFLGGGGTQGLDLAYLQKGISGVFLGGGVSF